MKKSKKKRASIVILGALLCVLFCICTASAFSTLTGPISYNGKSIYIQHNGSFSAFDCSPSLDDNFGYPTLQECIDNCPGGYTIVLNTDITESVVLNNNRQFKLDLNGHTLTSNGDATITVNSGCTITIIDSSSAKSGSIVGKTGKIFRDVAYGGCIYNYGTVNLESGTLTGKISKDSLKDSGGAVYNIGTFNMTGGHIKDSYAQSNGGAVYNTGNMTLSGNALISGCVSYYGAGIYNKGQLYVKGNASIKDCIADIAVGAIYHYPSKSSGCCVLSENASVIACNGRSSFLGAVYSYSYQGQPVTIKDNFLIKDCYANTDEEYGDPKVSIAVSATSNGKVVIQGGILLGGIRNNRGTWVYEGGYFSEKPSGITDGEYLVVELPSSNEYYKNYGARYTINISACSIGANGYDNIAAAIASVSPGQTISLNKNLSESVIVPKGKNFTLDLKGHGLSAGTANTSTIYIESGATVVVTNSDRGGGALFTGEGCKSSTASYSGGAIYNLGTLTLKNCKIAKEGSAKSGTVGGGIFNAAGAECTLDTGSVIDGLTARDGGAVFNVGKLILKSDACIRNCTATSNGSAIYNLAAVNMSGSSLITGNSGANSVEAVYNNGTLLLSGSSKIDAGNICKTYNGTFTVESGSSLDGSVLSLDYYSTLIITGQARIGVRNITVTESSDVLVYGGVIKGNVSFTGSTMKVNGNSSAGEAKIEGDITIGRNSTLSFENGIHVGAANLSSAYSVEVSGGWLSWDPGNYTVSGILSKKDTANTPDSRAPYTVGTIKFYIADGSDKQGPFDSSTAKVVPANVFIKRGFLFASWNTKADGSGKKYMPNARIDFSDGTVLYAQWLIDPNYPREAILKDNLNSRFLDKKITVNSTHLAIVEGLAPFTKYDYKITSWNTDPNGQGTNFPIGSTLDFGSRLSVTLYAQWTQIERMSFNSEDEKFVTFKDGSGNNSDFQFAAAGSSIFLSANGFSRSGYNLAGWSDGFKTFREGERYFLKTKTSDVLTAVWEEKGSSSFFSVGGEEEEPGSASRIITLDDEEEENGSAYIGDSDSNQVIYHDNVGTSSNLVSKTYDDDTLVMFCYFSNPGYSFTSWNTKADGSGTSYKSGSIIAFSGRSSIDLYAQWEAAGGSKDDPGKRHDPTNGGGGSGNNSSNREDPQNKLEEYEKKRREENGGGGGGKVIDIDTPIGENKVPGFADVYDEKYYSEAVEWALKYGITSGKRIYTDENGNEVVVFGPDDGCTRAEMVTFIWRCTGRPEPVTTVNPFADVKSGSFYEKAVLWAYENAIVYGTDDTHFSPDATCTRAHTVTFLWRSLANPAPTGSSMPFKDVNTNNYYYNAVKWAVENKVTSGTTATTFSPNSTCTRAQIVTFLYRVYGDNINRMTENSAKQ